jgi:hypothetical protein
VNTRPASQSAALFQAFAGVAVALLVMLGIGGLFYLVGGTLQRVLAPEGWVSQMFGRHAAGGMVATLVALTIGSGIWYLREQLPREWRIRIAELFVYTVAAAGGIYVLQMSLRG